jgi:hypothetical protein
MIEIFGLLAVCAMVTFYALEERGPAMTLAFAASCAAASLYAFWIASYPFMLAEGLWAVIAVRKWRTRLHSQK